MPSERRWTDAGDHVIILEGRAANGGIVRAFVCHDALAATAAHQQALARRAASVNGSPSDSDDAGPQLLSGFGASTWRRNVALVQSRPDTFAELMPAETDCTDLAPAPGPDLSRPMYRVDAALVALVDQLP